MTEVYPIWGPTICAKAIWTQGHLDPSSPIRVAGAGMRKPSHEMVRGQMPCVGCGGRGVTPTDAQQPISGEGTAL